MTDLRLIDTPATSELPPTSEDALALAFAERFADKLRYVYTNQAPQWPCLKCSPIGVLPKNEKATPATAVLPD